MNKIYYAWLAIKLNVGQYGVLEAFVTKTPPGGTVTRKWVCTSVHIRQKQNVNRTLN